MSENLTAYELAATGNAVRIQMERWKELAESKDPAHAFEKPIYAARYLLYSKIFEKINRLLDKLHLEYTIKGD